MIVVNSRFLTQTITGVQRYAIEISRGLKKLDPDIKFVSPYNIVQNESARKLDVAVHGKTKGHLWEQGELPYYLKKNSNPLLLNLGNTAPVYYKTQIATIHDLGFMRNPAWFSRKFYYYYSFVISKVAKNSLKIITVSNHSKKEIVELLKVPEDKVAVVHNSISEIFSTVLKNNHTNHYGDYILAVSSIDPRKNFERLIAGFNRMKMPDIKLLIAGDQNSIFNNTNLHKLIDGNNNIHFLGYVPDESLAILYKNARAFIYPSIYEGFGIPPLEAMACGCPVIASNTTSLPEVCGDAAYYIDPLSVDSIAEGMYTVLTGEALKQGLIRKGFQRVTLYSWEKAAKQHIKILEEAG